MTPLERAQRNARICKAYAAGVSQNELSRLYDLSRGSIQRIVHTLHGTLTPAEVAERTARAELSPEAKARLVEQNRRLRAEGRFNGRKPLPLSPEQFRDYRKVRDVLGPMAARAAFGIPA